MGSITYRAFTRGNFRENLVRMSKGINPKGMDAHHLLPYAFRKELKEMGINVNDPKFGRWVEHTIHNKTWKKYNDDFGQYLRTHSDASVDDLVNFAESLMYKYGLY